MNNKNTFFLTKIVLYVLPVFVVLIFIAASFLQYFENKNTKATIVNTNQAIVDIQELLASPEKINESNIQTLVDTFNTSLKWNIRNLENFWEYRIILGVPSTSAEKNYIDVSVAMLEMIENANNNEEPEPISYIFDESLSGNYSLTVIENFNFINDTEENTVPEEVLNAGNDMRIKNGYDKILSENQIEQYNIQTNKIMLDSYSVLQYNFTLNNDENIDFYLPLNWFRDNITCTSISIIT